MCARLFQPTDVKRYAGCLGRDRNAILSRSTAAQSVQTMGSQVGWDVPAGADVPRLNPLRESESPLDLVHHQASLTQSLTKSCSEGLSIINKENTEEAVRGPQYSPRLLY